MTELTGYENFSENQETEQVAVARDVRLIDFEYMACPFADI